MSTIYYFDDDGVCILLAETSDVTTAEDRATRMGAASYLWSDQSIHISKARNINGELVEVDPVVSADVAWARVREKRNIALLSCDWTLLPDSPLSEESRTEWIAYRQALRDITLQTDPFTLVWPAPPTT